VTDPFANTDTTVTDPFGNTDTTVTDPFGNTDTTVTDPFGNTGTTVTDPFDNTNIDSSAGITLEERFALCDLDFSNSLSRVEFETCYQLFCASIMAIDPTETCNADPVEQLMDLYDVNPVDGEINFQEFETFFAEATTTGPAWKTATDVMWTACQGDAISTINDE
jgi:hypothetical protein